MKITHPILSGIITILSVVIASFAVAVYVNDFDTGLSKPLFYGFGVAMLFINASAFYIINKTGALNQEY